MALSVKVPLEKAQVVKEYLISKDLIDKDFVPKKEEGFIFFPVKKKESIKKKFSFIDFYDGQLPQARKKTNIKEALAESLTAEEMAVFRRAFDVIGSIAILEIPQELVKKERMIADYVLKTHPSVKTVLKKAGIHETEFRTQPMQFLAGIETKETVHKELGVLIKLDVERVYFSPRLSTERGRVAEQVKPGEKILVMFSGCAPYPCVLAKNTKAKEIVGVELNPVGHDYGVENIKLNKITNVTLINGDVNEVVPGLGMKFDRIAMPLPKSAGDFLDAALAVAKKGTVVHFYAFEMEGEFENAHKRILEACQKDQVRCRILKTVKCGQQSPSVFRICVDFVVE